MVARFLNLYGTTAPRFSLHVLAEFVLEEKFDMILQCLQRAQINEISGTLLYGRHLNHMSLSGSRHGDLEGLGGTLNVPLLPGRLSSNIVSFTRLLQIFLVWCSTVTSLSHFS